MKARQTMPRQWLVADARLGDALWAVVRNLPPGSGVLVLFPDLSARERQLLLRRLRRFAATKAIKVVDEAHGAAARVHDLRDLRRALLVRTPLILFSPIYPTRSHPEWQSVPRMRAAALARLAGRRLFALGGMDERRFRRVQRLGFVGWAGIDAFRT
jgi:thiamine-phosphate pyrophosphorylase